MTIERALLLTQDIVRFCKAAGLPVKAGNTRGGAVIYLEGIYICPMCKNFTLGTACQKCAQPEKPESIPAKEM